SRNQPSNQHPCQHPLPAPPLSRNGSQAAGGADAGHIPPLNTKIERKPVPKSPSTADTPSSFGGQWIDEQALGNGGTRRAPTMERTPTDEDTLDRKAVERIRRTLASGGDSDSEYDDEPDYASVDTDTPPVVRRDTDKPRAGRMKIVGQKPE